MINREELARANASLKVIDVKGKGYAQVNERVKAFRDMCPCGEVVTEIAALDDNAVVVKATIRDETGKTLATGLAREERESSYINKTSYVENCETSAIGRALGFAGIGIDGSICSADELAVALNNQKASQAEKDVLMALAEKHKVPLLTWLMTTLTASDCGRFLVRIKEKYGDD